MTETIIDKVIQLAIEIQQIPAPTFEEHERSEFIKKIFTHEGLADVETDSLGNVYARIPGMARTPFLIVSAHLDTVFPTTTDLTLTCSENSISGPGIGDNSLGVAGLLGLLWSLKNSETILTGDVWLVGNVGEEGLGDLCGMRKVVERFGSKPLAYIVLEGLAYGKIYHRGLGVKRYRISVETSGGHSWVDYGTPSAIHELIQVAGQILAIRLPQRKRTTLNIGAITGGVSINTIAPTAYLEIDLRSESGRMLDNLSQKIKQSVRLSERPGVKFSIELIGDREFGEIPPEHPLVQIGVDVLNKLGVKPELLIGSTDANVPLHKNIPAICIGLTNGGGAHTPSEFMQIHLLEKGLIQLIEVIRLAFHRLGGYDGK